MKNTENKISLKAVESQDNEDLLHYVSDLRRLDAPLSHFIDGGKCEVKFNVMDNKSVSETLFIKEYKFWDRYSEAIYDRKYYTEMINSPDHLIFITGLIHSQRFIYAYLCHHYKVPYNSQDKESFKIWPYSVNIKMPKLVDKTENIIQKMYIDNIETRDNMIIITARTKFDGIVEASSKLVCYDIRS